MRVLQLFSPSANTNDAIRSVLGNITYGGTLIVTNLEPGFYGSETLKLFDAATYPGTFSNIQLPPLLAGYTWNTSREISHGASLDFSDEERLDAPHAGPLPIRCGEGELRLHETLQLEIITVLESLNRLPESPDYELCAVREPVPSWEGSGVGRSGSLFRNRLNCRAFLKQIKLATGIR